MKRCSWVSNDALYIKYHDEEWGKPVFDDAVLYEFLLLESFQAGLSWITILKKRANFRKAFDEFDYVKISNYNQDKIDELLLNEGIIRHRGKLKLRLIMLSCFRIFKLNIKVFQIIFGDSLTMNQS